MPSDPSGSSSNRGSNEASEFASESGSGRGSALDTGSEETCIDRVLPETIVLPERSSELICVTACGTSVLGRTTTGLVPAAYPEVSGRTAMPASWAP